MKKILLASVFALSVLSSYASQTRKVLIIGIDGARSDALQQANTPNITGLLANSLYSFDSWHTGITISGPSWSTILTGVQWNKHLVTGNAFASTNFVTYPPFPTLAKELYPNLYCSVVAEWNPLVDNITNAGWDHIIKVPDTGNWPTADSAVAELQNPDIDLLFAYFDRVDVTGHNTIFSPLNPQYITAIEDVDSAVGMVLNALYARPTYANEDWLILLITDHGGILFGHGGNSNEERHIWWIASGSAVAHQQINVADPGTYSCNGTTFDATCVNEPLMKQSPTHPDIAVTALHHLIYDSGINPETKPEWNLDGKSWLLNPNSIAEAKDENNANVFPNPANYVVTVLFDNADLKTQVDVFDIVGNRITEVKTNPLTDRISIDFTGNANGTYLLHLIRNGEVTVKKMCLIN